MPVGEHLKTLLNDVLQLGDRVNAWAAETPLLGSVPELDSMAVVGIITALEEDFGFTIADDEISADIFATLGSLTTFVEHKMAA